MISGRGPAKTKTVRLSQHEEDALAFIMGEIARGRTRGRTTRGEAIRAAIHHYERHLIEQAHARQNRPLTGVSDDESA